MRKGFTLIELLAVIVILAVIATIATPIILSIIEDAKVSSVKSGMNNIEKALELYYYANKIDKDTVFNCEDGVCKTNDGYKLRVSGQLPSKGVITISKSGKITYDTVVLSGYLCDKIDGEFTCNLASKNIISSEGESIIIDNNKSTTLNNYRIYGNSVQNGEPTPETPIEVESVGEKTNNLLDLANTTFTSENASVILQTANEIVFDNSTSSLAHYWVTTNIEKFNLKPNTTYTSKVKIIEEIIQEGGNNSGSMNKSFYLQDNNSFSSNTKYQIVNGYWLTTVDDEGYYYTTFTTPEDMTNLNYIVTRLTGYSKVTYQDFMIVEGAYGIDDFPQYEPYGYKIPINVRGKNLLDYKNFIADGKTFAIENGLQYEALTGTRDVTFDFTFKANTTYILSGNITGDIYIGGMIAEASSLTSYDWINKDVAIVKIINNSNEDKTRTLYCRLLNGSADVVSTLTNLQLEIGETVTDYEPYQEPITTNIYLDEPLRKIGNYVDYIDFGNKKLIRNVGSITLNGQEVWREKDGIYYLDESIGVSSDKKISISTHFTYKEGSNFWIDNLNRINIKYDGVENLEEFKEWLSNNNVTIHYPLKKSIIKEVEIPKINLNEKYSNISVDTSVKPSKILLEYN